MTRWKNGRKGKKMRLIDAEAFVPDIASFDGDDWHYGYSEKQIENAPTIDAIPIDYIMQRADALIEPDVRGARVLYGLVMNWNGEEQNE